MSIERIEIIESPQVVAVKSTGQRIVVGEPRIQIVTTSKVGAPGPVGATGPPGAVGPPGTGTSFVEELLVTAVPTEFALVHPPIANSFALLINGLLQASSSFSIVGTVVTLPGDLLITIGDRLTFSYNF